MPIPAHGHSLGTEPSFLGRHKGDGILFQRNTYGTRTRAPVFIPAPFRLCDSARAIETALSAGVSPSTVLSFARRAFVQRMRPSSQTGLPRSPRLRSLVGLSH